HVATQLSSRRESIAARVRRFGARHHLDHGGVELAAWMALGAVLALGALAGEALAYLGYTLAYREVARVEDGRELRLPRLFALVASGFGVFIPHGGFAADRRVL